MDFEVPKTSSQNSYTTRIDTANTNMQISFFSFFLIFISHVRPPPALPTQPPPPTAPPPPPPHRHGPIMLRRALPTYLVRCRSRPPAREMQSSAQAAPACSRQSARSGTSLLQLWRRRGGHDKDFKEIRRKLAGGSLSIKKQPEIGVVRRKLVGFRRVARRKHRCVLKVPSHQTFYGLGGAEKIAPNTTHIGFTLLGLVKTEKVVTILEI